MYINTLLSHVTLRLIDLAKKNDLFEIAFSKQQDIEMKLGTTRHFYIYQ
jgi:hypothetical protein